MDEDVITEDGCTPLLSYPFVTSSLFLTGHLIRLCALRLQIHLPPLGKANRSPTSVGSHGYLTKAAITAASPGGGGGAAEP